MAKSSPDLNPIEMLWQDLKRDVYIQMPSRISKVKQCCEEEWAKKMWNVYRKSLL